MNAFESVNKKRILKDKVFKSTVTFLSFLSTVPLFLIIYYIFLKGFRYLSLRFLTSLQKPMGEAGGGIYNAIIGSFIIVGIASIISIPIGITVGVFLSEYKNTKLSDIVKILVDTLQGIPSIVIGIIGYIWIVKPLKHFSAISGSIALAIMMLPIIIKSTEEILNMVPQEIKEGAIALGAPYYKIVLKVLLPYGFVGIMTGILLGISRIMGETAPLLFTAFGNQFLTLNIFKPMSTIPYVIFVYATSPYKDWHNQAFAASIVLILIVLSINLIGRLLEKRWKM